VLICDETSLPTCSEINTKEDFKEIYEDSSYREQNLLCELYYCNYFLQTKTVWNQNLLVGDIHLGSFISFIMNQIKWELDDKFMQQCELMSEIYVRGEHHMIVELFSNCEEILNGPQQVKAFRQA